VGGSETLRIDARIIAATNLDLDQLVKEKRLREDLYYRLNVIELRLPSLRERPAEIPALTATFIEAAAATHGKKVLALTPEASAALLAYTWPGNVRELRNAMERAALLSGGELILPEHLPARVRGAPAPAVLAGVEPVDAQKLEEIERQAVLDALRKFNFNRTDTARALGISRRALLYKLQRLREQGCEVDPRPGNTA